MNLSRQGVVRLTKAAGLATGAAKTDVTTAVKAKMMCMCILKYGGYVRVKTDVQELLFDTAGRRRIVRRAYPSRDRRRGRLRNPIPLCFEQRQAKKSLCNASKRCNSAFLFSA
jgi:hypothetical protein